MSKWLLYVTVFTTGGVVLALEILASRYMLPAFGTSIFIWGAILSVTLLSLATGYRWGGGLADGLSEPGARLDLHILLAAGWIGALPFWGTPVLRFGLLSGAFAGPLAVAAGLFAVPLTLLATIVPLGFGSALRKELLAPGRALGDLFAVSTAGSVAGALVTAYLAIPLIGLRSSFFLVAALLVAVVTPGLLSGRYARIAGLIVTVLLLSRFLPSQARGGPRFKDGVHLLHRTDTRYAQLSVLADERDGSRILLLDGASQNWVSGPGWSESKFDYIPSLLYYVLPTRPPPGRALVLGLGAGTLVRKLCGERYDVQVVELDPEVVRIARTYFAFPRGIAGVQIEDARAFLESAATREDRYDLIIVDVTGGGHHPEHVYNRNAYERIRGLLTSDGLLVVNMVLFTRPPWDEAARYSAATLASVFPFVDAVDLFPSSGAELSQMLLFARLVPSSLPPMLENHGPIRVDTRLEPLTDDWNPLPLWSVRANAQWHRDVRDWLGDGVFLP